MERVLREVVRAAESMSRDFVGALIVLERSTGTGDITESGVMLDAVVSAQLLINLFSPHTPLHDGAVVIRGNRILAAACVLPLSEAHASGMKLGTRHRAALGMSERTDAVMVVVSEETGGLSIACEGKLDRDLSPNELRELRVLLASTRTRTSSGDRGGAYVAARSERTSTRISMWVLAVAVALVVWMLAVGERTRTSPVLTFDLVVQAPLEVVNVGPNLWMISAPEYVAARLRAPKELETAALPTVTAVCDVAGLGPGRHVLSPSIIAPIPYELVQAPERIVVELEEVRRVDVNVDPPQGYTVAPTSVEMEGPASLLVRVHRAIAVFTSDSTLGDRRRRTRQVVPRWVVPGRGQRALPPPPPEIRYVELTVAAGPGEGASQGAEPGPGRTATPIRHQQGSSRIPTVPYSFSPRRGSRNCADAADAGMEVGSVGVLRNRWGKRDANGTTPELAFRLGRAGAAMAAANRERRRRGERTGEQAAHCGREPEGPPGCWRLRWLPGSPRQAPTPSGWAWCPRRPWRTLRWPTPPTPAS